MPRVSASRFLSSGGQGADPPGWDNGGSKNGGRITVSGGGGKDKGGKGGGTQWCCPKCGNACTVLERKYIT